MCSFVQCVVKLSLSTKYDFENWPDITISMVTMGTRFAFSVHVIYIYRALSLCASPSGVCIHVALTAHGSCWDLKLLHSVRWFIAQYNIASLHSSMM